MSAQLNVSYYGNKQDQSNLNTLMHTYICPIYLYDWTLNDLAYCHTKAHSTEQLLSVAGCPPCTPSRRKKARATYTVQDTEGDKESKVESKYSGNDESKGQKKEYMQS